MKLVSKLKGARIAADVSLSELSKVTGISKSTLQRYETGATKKIPIDAVPIIENALNLPTGYLMGWDETDSEKHFDDDTNTVIFNRNGEVIKRKFSEEQMNYLEKFINSIADEDYTLVVQALTSKNSFSHICS